MCCQLKFGAVGAGALWGRDVHSILPLRGGGARRGAERELLLQIPSTPNVSLSRPKGRICHVVDQPANMRAPPPFQHLARWEGGAQKSFWVCCHVFPED